MNINICIWTCKIKNLGFNFYKFSEPFYKLLSIRSGHYKNGSKTKKIPNCILKIILKQYALIQQKSNKK